MALGKRHSWHSIYGTRAIKIYNTGDDIPFARFLNVPGTGQRGSDQRSPDLAITRNGNDPRFLLLQNLSSEFLPLHIDDHEEASRRSPTIHRAGFLDATLFDGLFRAKPPDTLKNALHKRLYSDQSVYLLRLKLSPLHCFEPISFLGTPLPFSPSLSNS